MEKIPMEGLKASGDHVLLNMAKPFAWEEEVTDFLRALSQDRMNLNPFIMGSHGAGGYHILCCVAAADGKRLKELADRIPSMNLSAEFREPAGLISIFPHRSSLKTMGLCLAALARADVVLHGFCSSLAALTFIVDSGQLQRASFALADCFDLPGNQPGTTC